MKCPICNKGNLKKGKTKEYMCGVFLGDFPAVVCAKCKESFTDSATTKKIEKAAKEKGVWGLSAKTKITMAGNSLAVRIPKKIAEYLHLENSEEVMIYPENNKLIVEASA
ncbi:MAG: AbrB/MazE/SpoVT family DNA-binding domain-containing protein [Nanoarchaeota archaeon]|nr:AbrB/MazE/SpoVT family DNA-binding domain-containing protein [Nanoarchaeota archaeon]